MPVALAMALFVASGCAWMWLVRHRAAWRRRWRPRPAPVIGLLDLALMILLLGLFDAGCIRLAGGSAAMRAHAEDPSHAARWQAVHSTAMLLAMFGFMAWHAVRTGRWRRGGRAIREALRSFPDDLRLGLFGFILFVPPALLLQGILIQWIPYEHPTTNVVLHSDRMRDWLLVIWGAVLVGPLVEEYLFRRLLLSWLMLLAWPRAWEDGWSVFVGARPGTRWSFDPAAGWVGRWLPVIASAVIFSAMHIRSGPDGPVFGPDLLPLFGLGVGWAWLARISGRTTPSWIGHFLLNALTMASLMVRHAVPT